MNAMTEPPMGVGRKGGSQQHNKRRYKTAEKRQQKQAQAHRVRQMRLAQMVRLVASARGEGVTKGMVIKGVSGIGKTIGVVICLQNNRQ